MFKQIILAGLLFFAAVGTALAVSVEVNTADRAQLEAVKGVGPMLAGRILDERKKSNFRDWNDLISRVGGIGELNANRLSEAGLTVNGQFRNGSADPAPPKSADRQ